MDKKARMFLLAGAAALCLSFSVTAAAETFTSPDGVLSIDLPNEKWQEIDNSGKWLAFSDGGNLITVDHLSNGEKLPEMTVADDHYVNVYQAVFSTQNEVFIITGSVVDAAVIPDIANCIISAKVLQYDTKLAVKKGEETASTESESTVVPVDKTMYVISDGLNVRAGYSTDDKIIGGLAYGSSVKVTGSVQKGGTDTGWYQIAYDSGSGYVSAKFLSDKQPSAPVKNSSGSSASLSFTGEAKTLYEIDGHAVTVYKASDGYWYDTDGMKYTQTSDYDFEAANGAPLTTNKPQVNNGNSATGSAFTVYWENGNTTSLTPYSDGYYYSSDWIRYSANGDGTYTGSDGTRLYDSDPWNADAGSVVQHTLVSRSTGAQITVWESSDGSMIDGAGNNYYYTDDGSMYDDAENFYDIIA